MKQLIGLYGVANTGKTSTIKKVYNKLTKEFPEFILHNDFRNILGAGDISVIIIIDGTVIGIESQGDPNSRLFSSLPLFVKYNCSIILCATRTKGATVAAVNQLKDQYTITWIAKTGGEDTANYSHDNEKTANRIYDLIMDGLTTRIEELKKGDKKNRSVK